MKICMVLQRRFALIGHAIAVHMHAQNPSTEFCGIVHTRDSLRMLRDQRDIQYSSLLLEEDLHNALYREALDEAYLADFEKKHGIPNLWPYLYIDRVIMHGHLVREYPYDAPLLSLYDMKRRMQVTAKAIETFLDTEKPDAIVVSVIGSPAIFLLYMMARERGIKTLTIDLTRIQNRVALSEDYRDLTWVATRFKEIQNGNPSPRMQEAKDFLETFRRNPAPYHHQASPEHNKQAYWSSNFRFLNPSRLIRSIRWYAQALVRDVFRQQRDYTDVLVWWALWDNLKRKARGIRGYGDLYAHEADLNSAFAYYPLHYEPEIATTLYAPYFTNQLEIIRATAHALPLTMCLYVKEHPAMVGYRSRSFYKEMLRIPNVRLLDPRMPGHELSRRAALTVTITGTGGWEAALFKRPVITFGDVYYNALPGVEHVMDFSKLPFTVKQQLQDHSHDENSLINYIAACLEESVAVDYIDLWAKAETTSDVIKDPGIEKLAIAILGKLEIA